MRRLLSPVSVVVVIGVVALLGLLAYGVRSTSPDASIETALASGERPRAPALELPRLDGRGSASLSTFRGQVVVLNYWASWCEPCRGSRRCSSAGSAGSPDAAAPWSGSTRSTSTSDARAFAREFGLTYPMLRDADGETQKDFGVAAYPETIVIDRAGRIAALRRGPVDEEFMRREVAPLLGERTDARIAGLAALALPSSRWPPRPPRSPPPVRARASPTSRTRSCARYARPRSA